MYIKRAIALIALCTLSYGLFTIKYTQSSDTHVSDKNTQISSSCTLKTEKTEQQPESIQITNASANIAPRASKQTHQVIILDLNNFITENSKNIMNQIGLGTLVGYTLTHWRNPIDCCLDTLEKMGADTQHASTVEFVYKNRRMPHCIVAWQQGECPYTEVKDKLLAYIEKIDAEKFFKSTKEKQLAKTIIEMVLDPEKLSTISKSVPAMIELAQELKQRNYHLYAIANLAPEAFTSIKKTYPEIVSLFNGILTSSHAQTLKDDKRLLQQLLDTHHLDPKLCTLIDQDEKTVQAAQQLDIKVLTFTQQKNLRSLLKKQGIL